MGPPGEDQPAGKAPPPSFPVPWAVMGATVVCVLIAALEGRATADWLAHDATPQERGGFYGAVGAAAAVGVALAAMRARGALLVGVAVVAAVVAWFAYGAGARGAGLSPDPAGASYAAMWGLAVGSIGGAVVEFLWRVWKYRRSKRG